MTGKQHAEGRRLNTRATTARIANGLGWFSIGLGVAELLAPKGLSRLIGVRADPGLVRLLGLREIATGIGLLSSAGKGPWLKARVAGDALDLGLLGAAAASTASQKSRVAMAAAAVAGVTLADVLADRAASRPDGVRSGDIRLKKTLTINLPPERVYEAWRRFETFPSFMSHLKSVQAIDARRSHWVARAPAGLRVEWDAEMVEDKPNELISWRSLPGADVDNAGWVRFEPAPGNRGTIVRLGMVYHPPAGRLGATVAKLFGEAPEKQLSIDLLRFKQKLETGEVARTEGQPAGRSRSTSKKFDDFVRA